LSEILPKVCSIMIFRPLRGQSGAVRNPTVVQTINSRCIPLGKLTLLLFLDFLPFNFCLSHKDWNKLLNFLFFMIFVVMSNSNNRLLA
jgi:hypothetical protein